MDLDDWSMRNCVQMLVLSSPYAMMRPNVGRLA